MISFEIEDVKNFMSKLLIKDVFDGFYLSDLEINTYNKFHISGRLNQNWYTPEEKDALMGREYSLWSEIRPMIFQLVKGNKTPLSFKMVFLANEERLEEILLQTGGRYQSEEVEGLFLNIRYEKGTLHLVTGASLRTFTLDKQLEREWDSYAEKFLKKQEIY